MSESWKQKYRALLVAYATRRYGAVVAEGETDPAKGALLDDPYMVEAIQLRIWQPPAPPTGTE